MANCVPASFFELEEKRQKSTIDSVREQARKHALCVVDTCHARIQKLTVSDVHKTWITELASLLENDVNILCNDILTDVVNDYTHALTMASLAPFTSSTVDPPLSYDTNRRDKSFVITYGDHGIVRRIVLDCVSEATNGLDKILEDIARGSVTEHKPKKFTIKNVLSEARTAFVECITDGLDDAVLEDIEDNVNALHYIDVFNKETSTTRSSPDEAKETIRKVKGLLFYALCLLYKKYNAASLPKLPWWIFRSEDGPEE
jgi:hypothetical protein